MKLGLVIHEFGRVKNHGGIAAVYWDLVEALQEFPDVSVDVLTTQPTKVVPPANCRVHYFSPRGMDHFAKISDKLEELDLDWIEVADAYALVSVFLVRRELGLLASRAHVEVCHLTGFREIWEWGARRDLSSAPAYYRMIAALEAVQIDLADSHVAQSQFLADYLSARNPALSIGIQRFPTVDIRRAATISSDWKPGSATRILSIGRWESRKRQEDLLDAVVRLSGSVPDLQVHLVGNSIPDALTGIDYRALCFSAIEREHRSLFHIHDFASASELVSQYDDAGWFCIPSRYENFPTTAIEALARGLPVIGAASSGVADFSGKTKRVLFDASDPDGLKNTLEWASTVSDADRKAIWIAQSTEALRILSSEASVGSRVDRISSFLDANTTSGSPGTAPTPAAESRPDRVLLLLPPGSDQPDPRSFALDWSLRVASIEEIASPYLQWSDWVVVFPYSPRHAALEKVHELLTVLDGHPGPVLRPISLHSPDEDYVELVNTAQSGLFSPVILDSRGTTSTARSFLQFIAESLIAGAPSLPVVDRAYFYAGAPERLMMEIRNGVAGGARETQLVLGRNSGG